MIIGENGTITVMDEIQVEDLLAAQGARLEPAGVEIPVAELIDCECGGEFLSYVDAGIHYGYPTCCIDYFLIRFGVIESNRFESNPTVQLAGTGFVCCPRHDDFKITDLIALIEGNRQCPFPFGESVDWAIALSADTENGWRH